MALVSLDLNGTIPGNSASDGTNVTPANSGFTAVTLSGGSAKFDLDRGKNGLGVELTNSTTGNTICRLTPTSGASADVAYRGWHNGPGSTPTIEVPVMTLRHAAGVNARVQWTTADSLILRGASGADMTIATGLNPTAFYDLSIIMHNGTSTTGTATIKLRDSSGTQVGTTLTVTGKDFGTANFAAIDVGVPGTIAIVVTVGFDEIQLNLGGTTEIALMAAPTAPAGTVKPSAVTATGGWSNVGGATDLAAATADVSDTTLAQSPASPASHAIMSLRLPPLLTDTTALSITFKNRVFGTGTGTAVVRLKEGASTRKTWTGGADFTPPGTLGNTTITANAADLAGVTSYAALDLEFDWVA